MRITELQQKQHFVSFWGLWFFFSLVAMIIFLLRKEAGKFQPIKASGLCFFANLLTLLFLMNEF